MTDLKELRRHIGTVHDIVAIRYTRCGGTDGA
jgi:hypothetical protein